jgi:selenium metabolism protein YedF
MKKIDARNLACPAPVLATKEAIESEHPGILQVIVDNDAARQNVSRFLESQSYKVDYQEEGSNFRITGTVNDNDSQKNSVEQARETKAKKIMVMVSTDRIGYGDDELGQKLMINFIKTLKEMTPDLWCLVFVNNGVKLCVSSSAVLSELQNLQNAKIQILVCGTCLTHFNLLEDKQVGETTNMLDIVVAMQHADKVINI